MNEKIKDFIDVLKKVLYWLSPLYVPMLLLALSNGKIWVIIIALLYVIGFGVYNLIKEN